MIVLETPTKARLIGYEDRIPELEKLLSYKNNSIEFEHRNVLKGLEQFRRSKSYIVANSGLEYYNAKVAEKQERIDDLKKSMNCCLLYKDHGLWTRSGVAHIIAEKYGDEVRIDYELPEYELLAWEKKPFDLRPYQEEAVEKLLKNMEHGPCAIEFATGAGKTRCLIEIIKRTGMDCLVITPSTSIAKQMFAEFCEVFGKKWVGLVGAGKKEYKKRIIVAIDDSLVALDPDCDGYAKIAQKKLLLWDEAHTSGASTLEVLCYGLLKDIPLRAFVSATIMRGDGLDTLLDGITGPVVMKKELKELVEEGWLAKPNFKIVTVRSTSSYTSDDANKVTRNHLYYNPKVNKAAADIANNFVEQMKRPTLILVEEIEQFVHLLKYLNPKLRVNFAHGPISKVNKEILPEKYQKTKPEDLVKDFNNGLLDVLVGTSCISMGTDIRVACAGIYLMGKASEIKVRQSLGRMTRGGFKANVINPLNGEKKVDCIYVDFRIQGVKVLENHVKKRIAIYNDSYPEVQHIDYTGVY